MLTASFYTLGCRLNQTESALIAQSLKAKGYEITESKTGADLCVINSCTVTGPSDLKCRQLIRQVQKQNPGAKVAVIGCYSQMASEEILAIGGVDLVLGTEDKLKLAQYLDLVEPGGEPVVRVGAIGKGAFSLDAPVQHRGQTRANLKIQDGCDFLCSFCIIPQARGRSRSRLFADALAEARSLGEAGVKELVLTGVNLGCYEEGGKGFLDLLAALEDVPGVERIRISSIEPTTLGTQVFGPMADPKAKLVPHLHLPLQSGSDRVLKAMRRRYDQAEYLAFLEQAVREVPDLGVGTDVIVGFPGETDREFQETYDLLAQSAVQYFHVFPFALRPGTKAESMEGFLPTPLITERALALRELGDRKQEAFARSYLGRELRVLFEHNGGGNRWSGYGDNYLRVQLHSDRPLGNQLVRVRITGHQDSLALGELVAP